MPTTHKPIGLLNTPSSVRIVSIPTNRLDKYWPTAAKMLSRVIPYTEGTFDLESIYLMIKARDMQLWFIFDNKIRACIVTQILKYPTKKVCAIPFVVGDGIKEWLHLLKYIEDWARSIKCEALEGYTRKGFQKILDWKIIHYVMRKEL